MIAIDPGTRAMGVAIYECTSNLDIYRIQAYTIQDTKIDKTAFDDIAVSHSETVANIRAMAGVLDGFIWTYEPQAICCESPFFNRLRPGAYGPLVEIVYALRDVSIKYDPLVPFFLYAPQHVKKITTGVAIADKKAVATSIRNNFEITDSLTTHIDTLSEHAIDAIAVGWTHLYQLKSRGATN